MQYCFAQDIINYYTQVNEAKMLASELRFDEAILLYEKTFEEYEFEFARDCVHATEVASMASNDSLTNHFTIIGLKRGVPFSFYQSKKDLANFRKSKYWIQIEKDTSKYIAHYKSEIDQDLRDEINLMFSEDQSIRERYYRWYNFLMRPFIGNKWKKLNQTQVLRLVEITEQHGFPGERLIGIDLAEHHHKITKDQLSTGMPIIILVHHYSKPNFSHDSLFYKEVFKGNLYNEHFATISDFEAKFGKNKYQNFGYYGLRQKPKEDSIKNYDLKRAEIGISPDTDIQELNKFNRLSKFWNSLK